jgi:hypothetical protein
MRFSRAWIALGLGMALCVSMPALGDDEQDLAQGKAYLKDHLKDLNSRYPFPDWEKQAVGCRADLERLRARFAAAGEGGERPPYSDVEGLGRRVQDLQRRSAETGKLMQELYVASLVRRIDDRFQREGKKWTPDARLAFQRALMPYENGSLKPKIRFQAEAAQIEKDFRATQTAWLFAFAQEYLGHRVEEHLKAHDLARIESLYDDYSLQLDYWSRQADGNSPQALSQMEKLAKQYEGNKAFLKENLEGLLEALNTDFLFSDLLEYARKQNVEFTIEVEDKIEAALKERSQSVLAPIQQRIAAWKTFAATLKERTAQAKGRVQEQATRSLAAAQERERAARDRDQESLAEAEREKARQEEERRAESERMDAERREKEQLAALAEEQKRQEAEQKEKFKQTLTALKTFSFKGESSVELDDDSKKALGTKAGFLKTSYVRSGVNKLKVDKAKFSDTLAMVQKFTVEEGSVDFSNMSLQERSNQSAYTFTSPAGRTSQGDLENFVAEVALGSFSSFYSFLSYVTPSRWTSGRVNWMADRSAEKEAKDREFSYVDLVVDAHRKRSGGGGRSEGSVNLPANMIVIFDPQGSIIRFQSFADVDQVSIRSGDLVGGKLYYKFLNYSTDRQHIYLNGIDGEMKVASPGGKS